jgi:hypothetical protein
MEVELCHQGPEMDHLAAHRQEARHRGSGHQAAILVETQRPAESHLLAVGPVVLRGAIRRQGVE